MSKKIVLMTLMAAASLSFGQTKNVGIQTDLPHQSAILEVSTEPYDAANKKGLLIPRLNEVERNAIVSPAEGLTIFNTNSKRIEFYNGTKWISIITL